MLHIIPYKYTELPQKWKFKPEIQKMATRLFHWHIGLNHIINESSSYLSAAIMTSPLFWKRTELDLLTKAHIHTRAVRLIEIEIKSRFEIARFLNRFIARFFSAPLPQPPAVCYPNQSECSRTEQTGHTDRCCMQSTQQGA